MWEALKSAKKQAPNFRDRLRNFDARHDRAIAGAKLQCCRFPQILTIGTVVVQKPLAQVHSQEATWQYYLKMQASLATYFFSKLNLALPLARGKHRTFCCRLAAYFCSFGFVLSCRYYGFTFSEELFHVVKDFLLNGRITPLRASRAIEEARFSLAFLARARESEPRSPI